MSRDRVLLLLRLGSGVVFVVFGAGKFVNHASELASFQAYGLPAPEAFVYAIGVIELVGGLLLIVGLATRPAALVLAGDMIGAIVVSGDRPRRAREPHVGARPARRMPVPRWSGPGMCALDRRFAALGPGAG